MGMEKFDILAAGHEAFITLELDEAGKFAGTISSKDYGGGVLSGTAAADGTLSGTAELAGHTVAFNAKTEGDSITGTFRFAFMPISFVGTRQA